MNMLVDFEVSKALPEISKEKLREINNYLTNDMRVESEEDLEKITKEDLTKKNLLSSNQADRLVKYWNTRYKRMRPADNWHVYTPDLLMENRFVDTEDDLVARQAYLLKICTDSETVRRGKNSRPISIQVLKAKASTLTKAQLNRVIKQFCSTVIISLHTYTPFSCIFTIKI